MSIMKLYGKHTQTVVNKIIDAFKHPQQLPKVLAPIFIHADEDSPCRKWSMYNQLLVALAGTVDARGIKQWKSVGRSIKRGSKAIWILAPMTKRIPTKQDSNGEDNEEKRTVILGFRSISVFAVEDTEGEPLPEADPSQKAWMDQLPLLEVAEQWQIKVDAIPLGKENCLGYYAHNNTLDYEKIVLGVENLSTWCHELIHAADKRLGGLKEKKWHREVVAELGGAVLLQLLGRDHDADLGGAYDYIQSYAMQEKMDPVRACILTLNRTCDCVDLILNAAKQIQVQSPLAVSA